MASGALPTFLVIGAGKCGTTSLHHYLATHPEIQMSRTKELRFFQDRGDPSVYDAPPDPLLGAELSERRNWYRGVDWYRSNFDPSFGVRGESTPGYTAPHYPGCAARIASVVPGARLIFAVRDPVDRMLSTYRFRRGGGVERRPPEKALAPGSYYSRTSCYGACIEPYLERFPRERILIVDAERLDRDRRATLRRVFEFLGAHPEWSSPAFDRRWNVTATQHGARWRTLGWLRARRWWSSVATRVPRRALWLTETVTTGPARQDGERPALREDLLDELRADAARFRELVGHDFPDWSV